MRGIAGEFPLDYSTVCVLGEALVDLLRQEGLPPKVIIGRDTRESGKWIEQALFQGIGLNKGETVSAGILPTSAISFLTKKYIFSAGIVISASHNPYQDNGIKIFSSAGRKIPEAWEERLEDTIQARHRPIEQEITQIAAYVCRSQIMQVAEGLSQVYSRLNPDAKSSVPVVIAGLGKNFLAKQAAEKVGVNRIIDLDELYSNGVAAMAPAAGVALMAATEVEGRKLKWTL